MAQSAIITEPMSEHLLKKVGRFYDIDPELPQLFRDLCADLREYQPGTHFAETGEAYESVHLIEGGWVFRSKTLENGGRQIVNVAVPGDFICLNALLFTQSEFDLNAKSHVQAYHIDSRLLSDLLARFPSFAAALFWVNAHEESILAERIVSLGRRSARERTAHVLCEFVVRIADIDEDDVTKVLFPISQNDFADILGISLVHMNKTLRGLEADDVITFRNEVLTIRNMALLQQIAGFDDGYLHFTRRNDRIRRAV